MFTKTRQISVKLFVKLAFLEIFFQYNRKHNRSPKWLRCDPKLPPEIGNSIGVNIEADSHFLRPCLLQEWTIMISSSKSEAWMRKSGSITNQVGVECRMVDFRERQVVRH